MAEDRNIMLLGVYGMEVVECGGALAKNVESGGKSFASIMLCREKSQPQVRRAGEILGVDVSFTNFEYGTIEPSVEFKKKIVKEIRTVKPDIVITQDPEHSFHDLDPDRRQAMILILEGLALAGRDFALEEMPDLEAHPIPTIYYMSPENPNCIVNISSVWDKKEKAMDVLEFQMEHSGKNFERNVGDLLEDIVPGFKELDSYYEKGRAVHREIDKALHVYHGLGGHGSFPLAEAFRREGNFQLEDLML